MQPCSSQLEFTNESNDIFVLISIEMETKIIQIDEETKTSKTFDLPNKETNSHKKLQQQQKKKKEVQEKSKGPDFFFFFFLLLEFYLIR